MNEELKCEIPENQVEVAKRVIKELTEMQSRMFALSNEFEDYAGGFYKVVKAIEEIKVELIDYIQD